MGGSIRPVCRPVFASQITIFPEVVAEARWVPAGFQQTAYTGSLTSAKNFMLRIGLPETASQILTVLSQPAEARRAPSGLHEMDQTMPVCSLRVNSSFPVTASKTTIVPS